MNKNSFALTPPMGWNSYDYYDTTVNEEQVKANADYMAAHLKEYGWVDENVSYEGTYTNEFAQVAADTLGMTDPEAK